MRVLCVMFQAVALWVVLLTFSMVAAVMLCVDGLEVRASDGLLHGPTVVCSSTIGVIASYAYVAVVPPRVRPLSTPWTPRFLPLGPVPRPILPPAV